MQGDTVIVVLICISVIISYVENFFIFLIFGHLSVFSFASPNVVLGSAASASAGDWNEQS